MLLIAIMNSIALQEYTVLIIYFPARKRMTHLFTWIVLVRSSVILFKKVRVKVSWLENVFHLWYIFIFQINNYYIQQCNLANNNNHQMSCGHAQWRLFCSVLINIESRNRISNCKKKFFFSLNFAFWNTLFQILFHTTRHFF